MNLKAASQPEAAFFIQMNSFRIIFMGTPEFAVASLEALVQAKFDVVAVVTVADKPAGRGQVLQESPVKKFAIANNIPVLQPLNLKDPAFIATLASYKADLQFVVAFRMLPEQVWNMPRLGTYNLHGSLLPRYRGAAPINHAILNGDTESGVTTFKLQHAIDTGSILLQAKQAISEDMSAGELHDKLMAIGANLVVKTAQLIKESDEKHSPLNFSVQKDEDATHAPKIFKEHCKINWQQSSAKILNQIRGLSPYPTAFTSIGSESPGSKLLKIFRARIDLQQTAALTKGAICCNADRMWVAANDAWIELLEVQLEGKKKMPVVEFLKGVRDAQQLRIV